MIVSELLADLSNQSKSAQLLKVDTDGAPAAPGIFIIDSVNPNSNEETASENLN